MVLNLAFSICSNSAPSDSARGMPARSRVDSWRVNAATSCRLTRSTRRARSTSRDRPEPCPATAALPALAAATSVTITPSRRIMARSILGESASLAPLIVFPAASTPL